MAFVLPLLQDGRLKALAVGAKDPINEPIAIATALSQGIDYEYATWYGVLAPGKTAKEVLKTLSQAIADAGKDPSCKRNSASKGSNRATSASRRSTPISATTWRASRRC